MDTTDSKNLPDVDELSKIRQSSNGAILETVEIDSRRESAIGETKKSIGLYVMVYMAHDNRISFLCAWVAEVESQICNVSQIMAPTVQQDPIHALIVIILEPLALGIAVNKEHMVIPSQFASQGTMQMMQEESSVGIPRI